VRALPEDIAVAEVGGEELHGRSETSWSRSDRGRCSPFIITVKVVIPALLVIIVTVGLFPSVVTVILGIPALLVIYVTVGQVPVVLKFGFPLFPAFVVVPFARHVLLVLVVPLGVILFPACVVVQFARQVEFLVEFLVVYPLVEKFAICSVFEPFFEGVMVDAPLDFNSEFVFSDEAVGFFFLVPIVVAIGVLEDSLGHIGDFCLEFVLGIE